MKLIGLMPVRNEAWCLGLSARVALRWCDELILYVHASTDRSWHIALDLQVENGLRVHVARDDEECWNEMQHRQRMLTLARQNEATHIAIIDADEVLTGNILGRIRSDVEKMPRGWLVELPGYNMRGGINRYHCNGIWGNRLFATAFADDPRLGWNGDRFHHREPMGMDFNHFRPIPQGHGGVMHLWGASERRLIAKHALYKITERLRWPSKRTAEIESQYNLAFDPAEDPRFDQAWTYAETPAEWWEPYADLRTCLAVDAEPWQEAECRRLVAEHGAEQFHGLDLFGVDHSFPVLVGDDGIGV